MKKKETDMICIGTLRGRIYVNYKIFCLAVPVLLVLVAGAGSVSAQDLVWDNGAGTGNWNTTDDNWSGQIWDNSVPDNAVFSAVGGTINLTVPITAGSITFGSELQNCPDASFNGGSLMADSWTVQGLAINGPYDYATNMLTINVPAVSIGGVVAVGRAVLAITNGILAADQIISAPDSGDWADVIIAGNATVTVTNGIDGSVNSSQTFALDLLNGGTLYTPSITVADRHAEAFAGFAFFNWDGGKVVATASATSFITLYGLFDFQNNVYINNGGAILDTAGYNVGIGVNLVANGTGGLTKLGAGTLTLTGTNTYIGGTTVNGGTLVVTYPTLASTSAVIVNTNAMLTLNFVGTNSVGGLILGGIHMPAGVYNASTTPAYISGGGNLLVPALLKRNLVWDNGSGTGNWNTTDTNWSGLVWDNIASDNAFFSTIGGNINLTVPITAGNITFANSGNDVPNANLNGGSLRANSLTLSGNASYLSVPTNTANLVTFNVPTASITGNVAVGAAVLAITSGNFSANQIISDTTNADWAVVSIGGNATVTATNGIDGSSSTSIYEWSFALNLNGGTLYTPYIYMRSASDLLAQGVTWNGGKVVATASTNNFITLYGASLFTNVVSIGDGGAIIDTAGHDIGIGPSLVASGIGGLTKLGAGTLTLNGTNNTYTGNTTVNGGTLVLNYPSLDTNSTVIIASTAMLNLNFSGMNTVEGLIIGGVPMPPGVYNASTTPAQISGSSGSLLVSALAAVPSNFTITRSGSNLVLTWDGGGQLQSSTNVVGPYTNITGSSSPWTITPTNPQMYFRVEQ